MAVDSEQTDSLLRLTLRSEPPQTDHAAAEARAFLRGRTPDADSSTFILNLRELVNNAIEHGNGRDADKPVAVEIEAMPDNRVRLTVADQGSGFDHADMDLTMPDDPDQIRNRGLALINFTSDEMRFNESGNEVTIYMTLPTDNAFHVDTDGDWTVIRPTTDITAASADDFRSLLLELLGQQKTHYRFDLADVRDIDSVALSIFVIFANMAHKELPEAHLQIANAAKDIVNVFELTRLSRKYTIT